MNVVENVIIAPHPDDEIIGCWSLIKKGLISRVIYLDATSERFRAARSLGGAFNFVAELSSYRCLDKILSRRSSTNTLITYFVPDITDNHVLHKAANCIARLSGCKLGYYSVDMIAGFVKELSEQDKKEKRAALNKYYPDQKSLWENDWKYFLFEGTVLDF